MSIHERKTVNAMKELKSSSSDNSQVIENVLILQGGGSLGAFGGGVFKALAHEDVRIDIVAGTSIGGVNAAIIAGSKNEKQPEQLLEEFWLELADNFVDLDYISPLLTTYLEQLIGNSYHFSSLTPQQNKNESIRKVEEYRDKSIRSFFSSAMFGNDKMFKARW